MAGRPAGAARIAALLLGLLFATGSALAQQPAAESGELLERYFAEGQAAILDSRYADASAALERAADLAPGIPEILASLGFSYFQQARYQDAIPVLEKALGLNPGLPNVDVLLAACLSETGRFDEALESLETGFRSGSDLQVKRLAGLQLQRSYSGLGRDREAVETALALTKQYPDDPEVLYHSSRLLGHLAFVNVSKLSRIAPDSVWARQAAGEAYESDGQFQRAVEEYRKVLELEPNRPGVRFRIGRSLLRNSQDPESVGAAAEEFELELRADPTNANAAYELGEIHRQAGDLESARVLFDQAVRAYPGFEQARLGLGGVLTSLGQPEAALEHLRAAVAINDGNDVTYYRLSQTLRALGRMDEMREALATYQRIRTPYQRRTAAGLAHEPVTAQQAEPENAR